MTIRSDLSMLDMKYRAKRTGQTKAEYASAIEIHRPRASAADVAVWIALAVGAVAAIAAALLT